MSILSRICAGAIRPAIAQLEQTIGFYETTAGVINSVKIKNFGVYSPERSRPLEKELLKGEIAMIKVKTYTEKTIDDLRAAILTLKKFVPDTLNGVVNFSAPVIQIMESYLESNSSSSENSLGIELFIP